MESENKPKPQFRMSIVEASQKVKELQKQEEEKEAFALLLNHALGDDPDCRPAIPINVEDDSLYNMWDDGLILCKLINKCKPGTVKDKKIRKWKKQKRKCNIYESTERLSMLIKKARTLGLTLIGYDQNTYLKRNVNQILGMSWQLLRIYMFKYLNLEAHPGLAKLLNDDEDETIEEFLKLPLDTILMRWMNYHLENAKHDKRVTNFSGDVKDGTAYTVLLNQLDKKNCDKSGLVDNLEDRCGKVIKNAKKVGAVNFLTSPHDISGGNPKLNVLFAASIYNACPGLEDIDEREAYAYLINHALKEDPVCKPEVPINPHDDSLYSSLDNGIILCKMINKCQDGLVFDKQINNWRNQNLTESQKAENLNLAINAAKALGHSCKDVYPDTFLEGKKANILRVLYNILRDWMLKPINLKDNPNLVMLLAEGEPVEEFNFIPEEDKLLRWVNHHLEQAGHDGRVHNFHKDLMDGIAYTILLNQLDSEQCDKSGLQDKKEKRFMKILNNAEKIGAVKFLSQPDDISDGHPKLNLLFTASLYHAYYNSHQEEVTEEFEDLLAGLDDPDGDPRMERMYKNWINSLGIDGVRVNSIFSDLSDGLVLLKVLDRVEPGCVNWKMTEKNPNNIYKLRINAGTCIKTGKNNLKFKLFNCDAQSLNERDKKMTVAFLWQLVRYHSIKLAQGYDEKTLLKWANQHVPEDVRIKKINHKTIPNCKFLFALLSVVFKAIAAEGKQIVINEELVMDGDSDEAKESNAQYVLSMARMIGCVIFLTHEDIMERNKNMLFTLIAQLKHVHDHGRQLFMEDVVHKGSLAQVSDEEEEEKQEEAQEEEKQEEAQEEEKQEEAQEEEEQEEVKEKE